MSQRDIVVVPTYDRPEYLAVCLERLIAAKGSNDVEIWVCRDQHVGDHSTEIWDGMRWCVLAAQRDDFYCEKFKYFLRNPHSYYGNSFNIFTALKDAYDAGAERVYLVEDDVFVTEDFFLWHEEIQKEVPNAFVSIASRVNASLEYAINGPEVLDESVADPMAYYTSDHAYSSIGVCFNRDALHWIVPDFCNEETYAKLGPGVEQDLLIKKQMRSFQGVAPSVWPYVPRCYHMGWYGYHRRTGLKFNGTLEEKIAALKSTMYDQAKINSMAMAQNIQALPTLHPDKWWENPEAQFHRLRKYR